MQLQRSGIKGCSFELSDLRDGGRRGPPDQRLLSGVNFTSMGYAENLRYFTFGQGGYFSPQTYFAVTVPLSLSGRTARLAYHVRGALGVQAFSEDDSNYFPTDAAAQSAANAAVATANSKGLTNATSAVYPGQFTTGLAYNLVGSIEYQVAQQLCNSMWAAW
ncbi:cellulose synthase subunit BcsC-related outer membrane protein [Cupriavidus necator]|uniref:cellulose synthase subunit BcsC-related outer membrane protein n=1 Tax=Cupriavidus necator TaxID=106590 RepID=UPI0005B35322|nr:cellulose synthase subunit BcsC-related outer membrane protein [Cupriavidus necator]